MLTVILIECLGLSYLLTGSWNNGRTYRSAVASNAISGIIGIVISLYISRWWLVVWFPWMGKNDLRTAEGLKYFAIYYSVAFVLSVIIEGLVNYRRLRQEYSLKEIIKATTIVNVVSYAIGSVLFYLLS